MDNGWYGRALDLDKWLARTVLNGTHRAVIDCVISETYGWHDEESEKKENIKKRRTEAQISHKAFCEFTWISKSHISDALSELITWKIIKRDKNIQPALYWFNPEIDEWSKDVFRTCYDSQNTETTVPPPGNSSVSGEQFPQNTQIVPRMGNSLEVLPSTVPSCTKNKKGTDTRRQYQAKKTPNTPQAVLGDLWHSEGSAHCSSPLPRLKKADYVCFAELITDLGGESNGVMDEVQQVIRAFWIKFNPQDRFYFNSTDPKRFCKNYSDIRERVNIKYHKPPDSIPWATNEERKAHRERRAAERGQ